MSKNVLLDKNKTNGQKTLERKFNTKTSEIIKYERIRIGFYIINNKIHLNSLRYFQKTQSFCFIKNTIY